MSLALKILIPVAAVGAIFGIAHVAFAEPAAEVLPEKLQAQVQKALNGADPDAMRALAGKLRSQGFPGQAKSLVMAAEEIEQSIKGTVPRRPLLPTAQRRVATSTGLLMPAKGVVSPRSLAGRVALAFTDAKASAETPEMLDLLRRFQTDEKARGFYVGNVDGLYGPKSALALANDHNIVPPPPLYWPKNNRAASKAAYAAKLQSFGNRDPQRAEEWQQAARVA